MLILVPIKILSEANIREHWTKRFSRHKKYKIIIQNYLKDKKFDLPCTIILTRISPRNLDFDNLVFSLKPCVDIICDILLPGLQAGRADGTGNFKIEYKQRKGKPKEYALEIEITSP